MTGNNARHVVTDAHGRPIDLASNGPVPQVPANPCHPARNQRSHASTAIAVAAVLAGGLVLSVLLIVIRDIVTTLASTSATGLILKLLLTPSHRRER